MRAKVNKRNHLSRDGETKKGPPNRHTEKVYLLLSLLTQIVSVARLLSSCPLSIRQPVNGLIFSHVRWFWMSVQQFVHSSSKLSVFIPQLFLSFCDQKEKKKRKEPKNF